MACSSVNVLTFRTVAERNEVSKESPLQSTKTEDKVEKLSES